MSIKPIRPSRGTRPRALVLAMLAVFGGLLPLANGASGAQAMRVEPSSLRFVPHTPLGPAGAPVDVPPITFSEALPAGIALRDSVAAQDPTDPFATIDACVEREMASTDTPGASIAISKDGEVVYARGYGVRHEGAPGDVDAGTLFRIGSTTKMMTAAAVMQQVEAGRVDLRAPLSTYIPDWDINGAWDSPGVTGADVTPWHLLTHTSAYPDRIFVDTGIDGPKGPDALADWARTGVSVTLHAPPGSFWNYSNPGFALAGLVVQNVSGKPYADYMRDAVWAPAGMTTTFLLPADALAYGNVTYGHRWIDPMTGTEIVYAPDDYDNWAAAPAGYAFSRPTDMVRWADLLMQGGGDVISQASVDAMTAAQTTMDYRPIQHYGFGIVRTDAFDRVIFEHGGNIPGWSSQLYWSPDDRVAVSVLANTMTSLSGSASCALLTRLDVESPPGPNYHTDPVTWAGYLGDYNGLVVTGDELPIVVTRGTTDTLVATFPTEEIAPGVPYSSTMRQAYLNTFTIDLDGDGANENEVTFIAHPDRPGHAYWLRNRNFVATWQAPGQPTEPPPATAAPTATAMPPTATATSQPPTAQPPTATVPPPFDNFNICDDLVRGSAGVPQAAIAAAVTDPASIAGYLQPCFPSQRPGPFNGLRTYLSLASPGKPFHPIYNGLVWRCGCR